MTTFGLSGDDVRTVFGAMYDVYGDDEDASSSRWARAATKGMQPRPARASCLMRKKEA